MREVDNFRFIVLEMRKRAGLTQTELAQKTGITPQAICQYESGNNVPNMVRFAAIAKVCGYKIIIRKEGTDECMEGTTAGED